MRRCDGRKSRKGNLTEAYKQYLDSLPTGPRRDRKVRLQSFLEEAVVEGLEEAATDALKATPRSSRRQGTSDFPF